MEDKSLTLIVLFVVRCLDHMKYLCLLDKNYKIKIVHSIKDMEKFTNEKTPDLIVLDNDLMKTILDKDIIKFSALNIMIPILLLVNNHQDAINGLKMGIDDFYMKPMVPELLSKRIQIHIKSMMDLKLSTIMNIKIHDQLKEKSEELIRLQSSIIGALSEAIEFRDFDTETHNLRTQSYVEIMIRKMLEEPNPYTREIGLWDISDHIIASQLHDIGKIGIPDNILLKKDPLTPDEYEKIKEHVIIGERIIDKILKKLGRNTYLEIAKIYIISHHEYWNGKGYPNKLSGTDIPLEGRILAIVDVYDALTSTRPYKAAKTHEDAVYIINAGSGSQFDPEIVNIFNIVSSQFKTMLK